MSPISIEDAIRIAADGDAVLFVGAGIGFLVKGPNGKLPDGATLSNRLLERPDDQRPAPPLDKAAGFVIRKGRGAEHVYNVLKENFTVLEVDPRLEKLYRLPWRRIYTTNYDNAIQVSRDKVVQTNSCVLESSPDEARTGTVIHLNGQLSRLSPASIEREFSLSDRSYADRNLERTPWYSYLAQDLETARAVIFIGYSLYDLDISRLVFSSEINDKTFFFVSPDIDEIEEETIALYGQTPGGGVFALTDKLDGALAGYTPSRVGRRYANLREVGDVAPARHKEPTRLLDAQLVFGVLPEEQVIAAVPAFSDQQYVIPRTQQLEAQNATRRGLYRDVLIVGEFASGKTATALSLVSEYIRQGYKAYFALHGAHLTDDLAHLATIDDRIVVVFEGYSAFRKTIRDYARIRHVKHRMILTEQAVQHEFYGDLIFDPALAGQVYELNLDQITNEDAVQFARLIDFGGYWGERSGASDEANARYIARKLESSLYRVLSEIVESEEVQRRIEKLLAPILSDPRAAEIFIAACIVNVIGSPFRITDWVSIFDTQYVRSALRKYADELRYFFLVQSGHVFPRSGLLSSSILKQVNDRSAIVSAAVKLYKAAAKRQEPYNLYENVRVRLMQFNRIQPMMRGHSEKELIFKFYEEIKPIADTHKNADYWLQLGIAATAFDDLDIAGNAFENAYAREEKTKRKKNLKKIDNYYNRYLLKNSAALSDSQDAYDMFVEATGGLTKQMFLEDNRHYPFKSGRVYGEIARKHFDNWRPEQKQKFIKETESIRDKALDYERQHPGQSIDVEVLIRETGDLLSALKAKIA